MKKFSDFTEPVICTFAQGYTCGSLAAKITRALYDGTDAVGVYFHHVKQEERTDEKIKYVFSLCADRPIYALSYRGRENEGKTDDEIGEELVRLGALGASTVDVMGDLFAPCFSQLTDDKAAIDKQKDLIKRIHDTGAEVLMSSHIQKYLSAKEVEEMMAEQYSRGADFAKVVSRCDSEEEQRASIETVLHLKSVFKDKPFLFLTMGPYTRLLRLIGPLLGCRVWLAVDDHTDGDTIAQPDLKTIKRIRDSVDLRPYKRY